jgi:hypothetical protein
MNILNAACAVVTIASWVAGCATPAPAPNPVRATTSIDDVANCTLLGKVVVSDSDSEKAARDEVARLGGNMLLRKSDQVWNGNAYNCPAAAH